MTALDVLRTAYGDEVAGQVCDAYREVESHHALGKWKTSELDAGHFVEAVRRLLEKQFSGTHTPFDKALSNFSENVLKWCEGQSGQHDSYRLLIPRALWSIYGIRNKRGVGHVGEVSPNRMDSTFLLHAAKWVLAELVRLNSKAPIVETEALVTAIAERRVDGLWKSGDTKVVLDRSLSTQEQILRLLLDESPCSAAKLCEYVEYANGTRFRKILQALHYKRHIFVKPDGMCHLLPPGMRAAES